MRLVNIFDIHENCFPKLTINGLFNTRTAQATLQVKDLNKGGLHSALWNQTAGALVVDLRDFIVTPKTFERKFDFEFQLINFAKEQNCMETNVTLQLLTEYNGPFPLRAAEGTNMTCPLYVQPVNFTVAEISQNHSLPCSSVSIFATFALNAPLLTECDQEIKICGLFESTSAPTAITEVTGSFAFERFDAHTKCLRLKLMADTVEHKNYSISFELTHGAGASAGLDSVVVISEFFRTRKTMQVSPCGASVKCAPMAVSSFHFTAGLSGQTSRIPCNENSILVSLSVNIPILCDLSIVFSNVLGTDGTGPALPVYFSAPGHLNQTGVWDSPNLTASINASAYRTDGDRDRVVFYFTVFNQKAARRPSHKVSLQATFSTPGGLDTNTQTITQTTFDAMAASFRSTGATSEPVTFENQGLVGVQDISFTVRAIEQTSPYPCAANILTLTLQSDTELRARCSPIITLKGLTKSLTPSGFITLSANHDSAFNSSAAWEQSKGELTLEILDGTTVNQTLVVSFEISNPPAAQPAVRVQVKAWSAWQYMSTSPAHRELPGIYEHNTTYAGYGEHFPLHVRGLLFEVKHIGQSNPHPGCKNVLTVSLQVNMPLSESEFCHPKLMISVLSNAEQRSGQILLNAASGQCAASATADMLFQEKVDGVRGYGLWNDTADSLELWTANPMLPGISYIFSFELTNPMTGPNTALVLGQEV